jgi:hypothetical protein
MTTVSEEYTAIKVVCQNGKIVKFTGKQITEGRWPEDQSDAGCSITVYETKRGTLVAAIYNANENHEDVVSAHSQEVLITDLRNHDWAENDDFMGALQGAFPDEEIWTETIE